SRDPAGDIFFTRLILLRCQPEQCSYRLRLRDATRIVHRRLEGNRHHRTNARHCHQPSADGPASSPIRFTGTPSPLKKQTRAPGSLATFASFTILPGPSTTQTLESSKETSIPT